MPSFKFGLTYGSAGTVFTRVASWILSLLTNDSSTGENLTGLNWLNGTNLFGDEGFTDPSFDNAGDWSTSGSWVVSGGVASVAEIGVTGSVFESIGVIGETYKVEIVVDSVDSNGVKARLGSTFGPVITTTGTHTFIGVQTVSVLQGCSSANNSSVASISSISVRKVNSLTLVDLPDDVPIENGAQWNSTTEQYSWILSDGTKVAKTSIEQTTNGAVEVLDPLAMIDRVNDETIADGDIRRVMTTEGLNVWVLYNGAGTADSSLPVTSISDIGGAAITDNDTEYFVQSLQTATGLYSGLETNQFLTTPETPANQTTGSLGTDTYILTMLGTGSVSATDNTATSDAAGQSATEGTPLVIVVSGAGTIDIAITGSVNTFNLQDSPVETPFILTSPRSETVTSTPIAETKLTPQAGYGVIVAKPDRSQNITYLLGSDSGSDSIRIQVRTDQVFIFKEIATVLNSDFSSYTHTQDTEMIIIYRYDLTEFGVSAIGLGGTFPAITPTANTDPIVLGATVETGSWVGITQFQGEILFNGTFDSWQQAIDYINANNLADTTNL